MEENKFVHIYGAGLFGLTCARLFKDRGYEVTVYERSSKLGGMLYTKRTDDGVELHFHGAHIFHTNYDEVIDFVKRFSDWTPYKHRVKALVSILNRDKYVELPLSYQSIADMYGVTDEEDIAWLLGATSGDVHPNKSINNLIKKIGWDLYEKVIRPYSEKQWGCTFDNIPIEVIDRIGFKPEFVHGYFSDKFQALPSNGYDNFLRKLSEGVRIEYNEPFDKEYYNQRCINIYTGPIDDIVNVNLEYRSLRWYNIEDIGSERWHNDYDLPVLNTPKDKIFTRYIIHDNFPNQPKKCKKVIWGEESIDWSSKKDYRYYPVNNPKNNDRYKEAKLEIENSCPNLYLGGRLGTYSYLDMDDVIYNAIKLVESICE